MPSIASTPHETKKMNEQNCKDFLAASRRYLFERETGHVSQAAAACRKAH